MTTGRRGRRLVGMNTAIGLFVLRWAAWGLMWLVLVTLSLFGVWWPTEWP